MKYEIKIAENALFKTLIYLLIYFVVLFFLMYSFSIKPYSDEIVLKKILYFLNYPIFREYQGVINAVYIFNSVYFILYFAVFYIYEHICIHKNIVTRYKTKRWLIEKYLIGIVSIIIISLIEYGLILYVFMDKMPTDIKYYLYPILFKMLIMTSLYTLYNSFNTNKLLFLILLPVFILTLYYFNPIYALILLILTFIFNYIFFDLRCYKYIFKRN